MLTLLLRTGKLHSILGCSGLQARRTFSFHGKLIPLFGPRNHSDTSSMMTKERYHAAVLIFKNECRIVRTGKKQFLTSRTLKLGFFRDGAPDKKCNRNGNSSALKYLAFSEKGSAAPREYHAHQNLVAKACISIITKSGRRKGSVSGH